LIPDLALVNCLKKATWDLSIGKGMPGAVTYWKDDRKYVDYLRFGDDNCIEPLILHRSFYSLRKPYLEISEEFRTFHNLFHDLKSNHFYKFDESGNEILVAVIKENSVQIRLLEIRQFIAVREMHLALYFDSTEWSEYSLDLLVLTKDEELEIQNTTNCYVLNFGRGGLSRHDESFSRLLGKRIVQPLPKEKSGFEGFEERSLKYVDFIIGIDPDGDEIIYTSEEAKLSNNFGANPSAPHYLTPVFFRKTVLDKYYQQTSKYSLEAGMLQCKGLWSMRLDNYGDSDYIAAWLGDLGLYLPYEEALHWRAHNIPPAKISETFFQLLKMKKTLAHFL